MTDLASRPHSNLFREEANDFMYFLACVNEAPQFGGFVSPPHRVPFMEFTQQDNSPPASPYTTSIPVFPRPTPTDQVKIAPKRRMRTETQRSPLFKQFRFVTSKKQEQTGVQKQPSEPSSSPSHSPSTQTETPPLPSLPTSILSGGSFATHHDFFNGGSPGPMRGQARTVRRTGGGSSWSVFTQKDFETKKRRRSRKQNASTPASPGASNV